MAPSRYLALARAACSGKKNRKPRSDWESQLLSQIHASMEKPRLLGNFECGSGRWARPIRCMTRNLIAVFQESRWTAGKSMPSLALRFYHEKCESFVGGPKSGSNPSAPTIIQVIEIAPLRSVHFEISQ